MMMGAHTHTHIHTIHALFGSRVFVCLHVCVCVCASLAAGIETLLEDAIAGDADWRRLAGVPGMLEPWGDVRDKWQVATDEFKVWRRLCVCVCEYSQLGGT